MNATRVERNDGSPSSSTDWLDALREYIHLKIDAELALRGISPSEEYMTAHAAEKGREEAWQRLVSASNDGTQLRREQL